ncbi:hypothetical protein ABID82_005046 [Methylobacterium sp. PvP062]|uniref:DUF1653 domain-containing protein n=1 Tax=Methylobacterium TaxID=407 RepID=UPI001AE6ED4B|nr:MULTISPECIES: DUF1653 domain-containing protein [unclassified Methylobacterium]MBP2498360.1 hypothetical protein [Methylobacterium sp. PvP105]MBP2505744.1 hypothetical protein [Methylobacterium sp. PvP109]
MTATALSPKPDYLPGRGSIWRHHKGTRYRVAAVSRHSENPGEWLVTYEPVEGGDAWTRALLFSADNQWAGFADSWVGDGGTDRFTYVSGPRTWRDEPPAEPTREQLLEMLDNVSAAARNLMIQFGGQLYRDDAAQRRQLVDEARALCDGLIRGEVA